MKRSGGCGICYFEDDSNWELTLHFMKKHTKMIFKCPSCNAFMDEMAFKTHKCMEPGICRDCDNYECTCNCENSQCTCNN